MAETPSPHNLIRITNMAIELEDSDVEIGKKIAALLSIKAGAISEWQIVRKAIDARKKSHVHFVCTIECSVHSSESPKLPPQAQMVEGSRLDVSRPEALSTPSKAKEHVVVVGSGPAGLFAALALIEAGMQVTLLERGKPVEARMRASTGLPRSSSVTCIPASISASAANSPAGPLPTTTTCSLALDGVLSASGLLTSRREPSTICACGGSFGLSLE